jgi:hypothetical protein
LPIDQQFGYFAPQVGYEHRIKLILASSDGERKAVHVKFPISAESKLLFSTFENHAAESSTAAVLSYSIAEYGFARRSDFDLAEIQIQYRMLPPVEDAARLQPTWVLKERYYFRR